MTDLSHLWISRPLMSSPSGFLEFLGVGGTLHPQGCVLPCGQWGCRGIPPFPLGVHLVEVWKLSLGRILQVCPPASLHPQLFPLLSDPCSFSSPTCWTPLLMPDSRKAVIYFWEQLYLMCVSIGCTSDLRVLTLESVNNPNRNGKPFTASFCGIKTSAVYGRNLMIPFRKIYFDIIF